DVGSAEEVGKYLQETGRARVKAANLLRRAQLSSPTAYRLLRSGLWLHLDRAPPAGAGGKTQIPALPAQRRTQFGLMSSNAKWADLLEETESALAQFRFSLDLQRMSAEALQQLGAEYEPARQALLGEVSALLRRMPELPELNAGDGSPLADDQTREWIASDIAAAAGGGGSAGGAGPSDDPGEAFGKIGSMMKSGKGGEAMKAAKAAIDDTGSLRLRFIRRLALAQGCFEGGEPKLARSMFVALDHELSERGLDQWEPRLASQCLEGLLKSSRAAAQKGAATPGVDEALQRLSLIDPVAAARFSS
ncbi:MAG: type VI secretion system domain-containing protein, partial [Nannocystaceae bacterium]